MKKHCVFKKTEQKIIYICDGEIPEGFWLEDSDLGVLEFEGADVPVKSQLVFDGQTPSIVETLIDLSPVKWTEIRAERDELLAREVDSKKNYMIFGDLSEAEIYALKSYRTALLNVPQDIEAKIASGEIASVMDVDVESYPWPVMG